MRYADFRVGNEKSPFTLSNPQNEIAWLTPEMAQYTRYITRNVDGIISCLYEYYRTYKDIMLNKLAYGGISMDTDKISFKGINEEPEKVKFFIGIQKDRSILKGTDILLEKLAKVVSNYPEKAEIVRVENLPYNEYVERMLDSHVLVDQLYSYTPATNALIAMARGLVVVSGAEPEYYEFINENEYTPEPEGGGVGNGDGRREGTRGVQAGSTATRGHTNGMS